MHDRGIRLPVAVGVAVVAAGAATLALRPRSGLIQPAPVKAQAYFSPAELDRIHDYVGPQRALAIGGLVVTGAVLAFVALRPPRRVRPAVERAGARPRLRSLAARAAVGGAVGDVGQVYRVDASRRTTGANAYVAGLGSTKRVGLYDNLIQNYTRPEIRSVVAHELGHVKHRDVPRGILWLAIVGPAATLLVQAMVERIGPREDRPGPAVVPAAAFSIALVSFATRIAGHAVSPPVG